MVLHCCLPSAFLSSVSQFHVPSLVVQGKDDLISPMRMNHSQISQRVLKVPIYPLEGWVWELGSEGVITADFTRLTIPDAFCLFPFPAF